MRLILRYMKDCKYRVICCVILKSIGAWGELMIPYILAHIIDDVVPTRDVPRVLFWGVCMALAAVLTRVFNVTSNRTASSVGRDCIRKLRHDLFKKTMSLSGSQFDGFSLPSLISRMTSDSYNVQDFIVSVQSLGIRAPTMLIVGIIMTLFMDPALAAILCVIVPVLGVVIFLVTRHGIPLYDKVQQSVDRIVRILRENITGIRVVKALSREEYEKKRFRGASEQLAKDDIKASFTMAIPQPTMQLALNIGLVLVVVVGARRVDLGLTKPGVILAFLTYFNMILQSVMSLNRIFMMASKATASANRIERVLESGDDLPIISDDQEGDIIHTNADSTNCTYDSKTAGVSVAFEQYADTTVINRSAQCTENNAAKLPTHNSQHQSNNISSAHIAFDHVSFSYHKTGEQCLSDIDFSINKGESLGIIGATGSGKTSIINLLMRFYDCDMGRISIDGRDVRSYDKDELREKFGVVFQNDIVFRDTLAENIRFERDIPMDEVRLAAASANISDFIESLDDGYEHRSDIKGANLSGGQKQRILISRAIAGRPEILVLDDASSALDYKTDAALRQAIRANYKESTLIMVAQRVSSVMKLDHILVLDGGAMIGYGTHEELLRDCPTYLDIYQSQMGEIA